MFDALLGLSQSLVGTRQGGLLSDALHTVLDALGCTRGAAYAVIEDALALVGERGLPADLRASLDRLSLAEPPWFIAQRAAQARRLVSDRAVTPSAGSRPGALAAVTWARAAVACPIVAEREVLGVLLIAAPAELGADALAALRIACNMLSLQMSRASVDQRLHERGSGDARAARVEAVGLLAGGFAGEVEPAAAALGHEIEAQQQMIERLRGRIVGEGFELEELAALAARCADAARRLQESAARLQVAVRPGTAAERLDLGRLVEDALALLRPLLERHRTDLHAMCPEGHLIVGRRGELLQLFLHVLINVAGAVLDEGPTSRPSLRSPRIIDVRLRRRGALEVVSIADSSEDVVSVRSRLLASPAAAQACGQGLGFAAARQIALAHRGHIALDPASDGGVRCDVVLPAEGALVEPSEPGKPEPEPPPSAPPTTRRAIGRITLPEPAISRRAQLGSAPPSVDMPAVSRPDPAAGPTSRARAITPGSRSDPRLALTEPMMMATPPQSGRGEELGALARAVAATLRSEGPKRGSVVLEMLHRRGLSESEALSVVTMALSTGALVREPAWSTMLKAPEPAREGELGEPPAGRGSAGNLR